MNEHNYITKNYEIKPKYNLIKNYIKKGIKNNVSAKNKIKTNCKRYITNEKYNNNISNPNKILKIKKLYKIIFFENIAIILLSLIINYLLCLTKEKQLNKILHSSEITITINGTGEQKILPNNAITKGGVIYIFNNNPNKIYVNGILQNCKDKKCNLSETINNVTMWYGNIILIIPISCFII